MTASDFAKAIGKPYRTAARWLSTWHHKGVAGIVKIKAQGQGGAWRIEPSVLTAWRNCELPAPHG